MEPSINEIEKALKYVSKEGYYYAGKRAMEELRRIAEWQNQSVSEIHALRDSLKVIKSDRCLDIVKRELKLAKLIYKHDLKKKMRWRRIMKLAQNLYAWGESTRSLLSGIGEKDNKGYWHKMYHVTIRDTGTRCTMWNAARSSLGFVTSRMQPMNLTRSSFCVPRS